MAENAKANDAVRKTTTENLWLLLPAGHHGLREVLGRADSGFLEAIEHLPDGATLILPGSGKTAQRQPSRAAKPGRARPAVRRIFGRVSESELADLDQALELFPRPWCQTVAERIRRRLLNVDERVTGAAQVAGDLGHLGLVRRSTSGQVTSISPPDQSLLKCVISASLRLRR